MKGLSRPCLASSAAQTFPTMTLTKELIYSVDCGIVETSVEGDEWPVDEWSVDKWSVDK